MSNFDQFTPRYLVQKQLKQEFESQRKEEERDARRPLIILASSVVIPIALGLYTVGSTMYSTLTQAGTEIAHQVEEANKDIDLARNEGNIRVIITYSDQAEIHHIMKKLQRMGYEVSSTQTKGTYITGALGGVKQFRVEDHKFSNEYDLYAYLNSINGGAK